MSSTWIHPIVLIARALIIGLGFEVSVTNVLTAKIAKSACSLA